MITFSFRYGRSLLAGDRPKPSAQIKLNATNPSIIASSSYGCSDKLIQWVVKAQCFCFALLSFNWLFNYYKMAIYLTD
jgi:hypothetical protein